MKESRDILSLFEALNNHEVFTPPRVARAMLDILPNDIWQDPSIRILDPSTKSGVFLREAFYRFFNGLQDRGEYLGADGETYDLRIPQQRINHIFKNMLFGIATSELTSYITRRTLYGVMMANTDKQIAAIESFERSSNYNDWSDNEKYSFIGRNKFNEYYDHALFCTSEYKGFESEGNIFYPTNEVARQVVENGSYEIEDMYYPFIESGTKHQKIQNIRSGKMKFDVIVGNPPYQVSTSHQSRQAKPIYNLFVEQAVSVSPRFIVMITPSRWFSGGMGLANFRATMMSDRRLKLIMDYPNSKDCFPGLSISGGVNYFLWQRDYNGCCYFSNSKDGVVKGSERYLDEYNVIVRYEEARSIINKIKFIGEAFLSDHVQAINAFDLSSSFRGSSVSGVNDVKVIHSKGEGFVSSCSIVKGSDILSKYKVVVSRTVAEHANEPARDGRYKVLAKTMVLGPNEVCTHSYLVVATYEKEDLAKNCRDFLQTKLARFLILQTISGIDLSKERFSFVPFFDYPESADDDFLYEKYGLNDTEVDFVESMVKSWEQ